MSGGLAHRVAWALAGLDAVLALPTAVLLALGAGRSSPADEFGLTGFGGLGLLVASLTFATIGALIASRLPGNGVGWIFCAIGVLLCTGNLGFQYADHAFYGAADRLPGGVAAAWLQNLTVPPAFALLALALLLFPGGRLPSHRWRPAAGLAVLGIAGLVVGYALRPGPLDHPFELTSNPVGVAGAFGLMDALIQLGWLCSAVAMATAAVALANRLRRSRGGERQQLKWIVLAAAVLGAAVVVNAASFAVAGDGAGSLRIVVVAVALASFALAAGAAILRYRLFDIDVVLNRTLVYGALTAALVAAYLGSVLLLQLALVPLTSESDLAIAGSTLAVAALFRPMRSRIQAGVDRRFYRRRYNARRTLESFGTRLRDEVDLDAVSIDLRAVVAETVQPAHVSLWLRAPETRT
jgi:hypothetical protein